MDKHGLADAYKERRLYIGHPGIRLAGIRDVHAPKRNLAYLSVFGWICKQASDWCQTVTGRYLLGFLLCICSLSGRGSSYGGGTANEARLEHAPRYGLYSTRGGPANGSEAALTLSSE